MRAAVLHGQEDLRIENHTPAELAAGEVRILIEAALTCGTDLKVYKRGHHARMIVPPSRFGHELAGVICELGAGVEGWRVGDRVVAANSAPCGECFYCQHGQENLCDDLLFLNGAYAESIVVPARIVEKNLLRVKAGCGFADAALAEPFACVAQGVNDLGLSGHERMLVIGSGPIGLMFAALGRHLGCPVAVAGRGEERLALARRLGAAVIEVAAGEDAGEKIRAAKRTFDVVIEAAGKPETWELAVQLVRKGGAVNLFGGCPTGSSVRLDTGLVHYSNLKLLASFHHTPRSMRQALELIEQGVVSARDFVTGECGLEGLPALFAEMARGNRAVKTLVRTRKNPPGAASAATSGQR